MINVRELTQHYGIRAVLKNISLQVNPGELVALMGPNGMGKSTLLAAMAGILSPQKGCVEIDGIAWRSSEDDEMDLRRKVFYLPDHPWLPLQRSAREYLVDVGRIYEVEDERLLDHVDRLLDLFALTDRADSPINAYSAGQQKKTAVCAALVSDAPIQLLDEPFSGGLDPSALLALRKVLEHLAERDDVTVVMATPVPSIVEGLANRIAIIREGELIAYDTPEALKESVDHDGMLEDVLEQLIDPRTHEHLARYFEAHR